MIRQLRVRFVVVAMLLASLVLAAVLVIVGVGAYDQVMGECGRALRVELQRAEDISADFGAEVQMLLTIRAAEEPQLLKSLADLSAGSAAPERLEQLFYPFKNT